MCLGALSCVHIARGNTILAVGFFALAATIGLVGLVMPRAIRPVFVASVVVTFPIGWVVSRLALAFLFYAVLTPIGLWFRLIGRDTLVLRHYPGRTTYWTSKPVVHDVRRYFQPF
jgi:hypothetical protein